jgi:hypothetical protein
MGGVSGARYEGMFCCIYSVSTFGLICRKLRNLEIGYIRQIG